MNKVSGNLLRFFKVAQILPFIFGAIVRLLAARRNGPGSSPEKIQKLRSPSAAFVFRREKKRKKEK
jgi:hypothetical protein